MLVTEFSTSHLPAAERFDHWCGLTADTLIPNTLGSDHASHFEAELRLLDLGLVQISALRYPPLETHRPAKLIRRSDPEVCQLMLNLRGGHRLVQAGLDTTSSAGELMLYDTSRPWHGWATAATGSVEGIMVQFPRQLLPLPQGKIRSLTAARLSGREGMGALLAGFLRQMAADAASYTVADTSRLATITIDLLAAVCAHHLDTERHLPPETHHHVLLLRIRAFIEQHLGKPGLTPAMVAAAHNISTRHLHRLFQTQGLTVAGLIRQRRLENCHRELTDPHHNHRTIQAIAAGWGFADKAHFSRLFLATFGMAPSHYRHLHKASGTAAIVNRRALTDNDIS
ncbi:helix-turn-helix domain-containing protein [Streptomyces violaceusniger]|uniref:Transcriptional regulator, AraC family n=1 Tax=Streptomyces violaceusniger (strain Tu 4113) TaxID=653045 RepID=G2P6I8_STRV4|nr:helix-turn-helix domain-containing protein [Streptomyces violaceusniger]AEM86360.1 transcriptional regulator, AraC family [Streptomyces violaceusniger Tu 4113]